MCKAVALFYNIRIGNKRFIEQVFFETCMVIYNERKTLESRGRSTSGGKKFQWKQIGAELAGIFVECSLKFISV